MMPAQSRIEAGIWSIPGYSIVIEYSRPVLKGILRHTVEGFDAYLAGGFEVGGVLFGEHSGNVVRILAFRPFPLEPPRPTFVMSESDGNRLKDLIQRSRRDPDLSSMEVVGWYHSHTRSEIFLSESDTEIYDRYFPEPWQVAMVLRPTQDAPVSIGFFFREDDGFIRTDQSYQEFAAEAPSSRPQHRPEPPWVAGPSGEVEEFIPQEPPPEPEPAPAQAENLSPVHASEASNRRSVILAWSFFVIALLALAAGAYNYFVIDQPLEPLGLHLAPSGGELIVRWTPSNPLFREATDAQLVITDGRSRVSLPLLGRKTPFHTYRPLTDRVDVRLHLKLSWGRTRTDSATYLRHPEVGKPSPELAQARANLTKAEQEAGNVRRQVADQAAENARIQNRMDEIQAMRRQMAEARKPKKLVLPAPRDRRAAAVKDLPSAPEIAVRSNVPLPPQTDFQLRPPVEPPKPVATPAPPIARPAVTSPAASAPKTTAPAVVAPTPAVVQPASGRIIWTGDLPRGATLQILGRQASRGFLNSELPASARVGAYPAELTNDGLKVYTGNPRYAQSPRTEPASAANGWQKTQYVYDPKTLRDLIVEQMPGPQDPRELVLRAGRRLSIIVIEWQVVAP